MCNVYESHMVPYDVMTDFMLVFCEQQLVLMVGGRDQSK